MSIQDKLIVNTKEKYGKEYRAHSLAIYQLYIQLTDNISSRRQSANSFFLTINTAILGFVGYVGGDSGNWNGVISIAGMFLCYTWFRLIRSYKDMNSGKFKIIHEIEKELPLSPFNAEWEALGRGKDTKLYLPFTNVEKWVPVIFGALHLFSVGIPIVQMNM